MDRRLQCLRAVRSLAHLSAQHAELLPLVWVGENSNEIPSVQAFCRLSLSGLASGARFYHLYSLFTCSFHVNFYFKLSFTARTIVGIE